MTSGTTIKTIYHCSLERAFKTPMLCDVSRIHTGFGIMPKVIYCTEDEHWGTPGYGKKVFVAGSPTFRGGEASTDRVLERRENEYWKIEVSDFKSWMLGFTKFVGEWSTREIEPGKVLITYTYTLHSDNILLYPANWLFAKTFWRMYMKRVLENVRTLIRNEEPYLYS